MNLNLSNNALWRSCAAADIRDETHAQVGQVETTVESAGVRGKITARILDISEGLAGGPAGSFIVVALDG